MPPSPPARQQGSSRKRSLPCKPPQSQPRLRRLSLSADCTNQTRSSSPSSIGSDVIKSTPVKVSKGDNYRSERSDSVVTSDSGLPDDPMDSDVSRSGTSKRRSRPTEFYQAPAIEPRSSSKKPQEGKTLVRNNKNSTQLHLSATKAPKPAENSASRGKSGCDTQNRQVRSHAMLCNVM